MEFEILSPGAIYIGDQLFVNEAQMLSNCEEEISASEKMSFNVDCEFSGNLEIVNTDLFNKLCMPSIDNKFKLVCEVPIMIQTKWHKKPRINKKWLKRYGMKPDVVKMEMNAGQLEYIPGEMIGTDYCGIVGTYNHFNFETDEIRYIFRNDQLIKNRKIEFGVI